MWGNVLMVGEGMWGVGVYFEGFWGNDFVENKIILVIWFGRISVIRVFLGCFDWFGGFYVG